MDKVIISPNTARISCQIYNDATLYAYFPFDTLDPLLDRSVNLLHGIANKITINANGCRQQAICYPPMQSNRLPFSVSFRVNPMKVLGGGTLVHVSQDRKGNVSLCYDLLGFTDTGVLAAQLKRNQ